MMTHQRLFGLLISVATSLLLGGCAKNITEYYNPKSAIDKNIIEVLEEDGRFSAFVGMIDRLGLRKTLGEAAIYTCLAPPDDQVSAYFASLGYASVDAAPDEMLRMFINYHFISGMYYQYDIEQRYLSASTAVAKSRATRYRARTEGNFPGKVIRFYTPYFFQYQEADYLDMYGGGEPGFMVEGARISETDRDIGATNGVIHVLETPLGVLPRTDIALANDPETSLFSSWQERHAAYVLGERDEFGWVDTTLYKTYETGRNLADENVQTTMLVPTNEAILNYFEPYLPELDNTIDSVPKRVMASLIRTAQLPNYYLKSDLVSKEDNGLREARAYVYLAPDIANVITGSVPASNSVIYKTNVLIESADLNSVEGGIYMKHKTYSQWYWMFERTNLNAGLTDGLSFQHPPVTLLVQPDDVWGFPLAADMLAEDREYRYRECRTGVLNLDVREDGGFRRRFYPTEFGYILYQGGRLYDHTGHSVALLSDDPVWERSNGAIFEIDGFLTPLDRQDAEQSLYAKLTAEPELSRFVAAVNRAGSVAAELSLSGFFIYTVFAPTNAAIEASGIDLDDLSEADLIQWVNRYIVPSRYVFADGVFTGQLSNRNGRPVWVNGAWETFSIRDGDGTTILVSPDNVQGTNGVFHKINQLF
ncbi:fasciclin domain-containing protein [Parapedobacter deserti]|uniref:Fasciclin domain-containing protein n=1 Tax=Parapedobacter deserti TaxID=1912957 RepID=A0ABV7JJ93_9SPHI